jgi:hypothetical protein
MLQTPVIDLSAAYQQLARAWTHEQLAARYDAANRAGAELVDERAGGPITILATAIPPAASLGVAVHVLHALPSAGTGELAQQLRDTAARNATDALRRCHRALELDGQAHDYTAGEWLPVVYDVAAPLLQSSRLDQEPPTIVQQTQEAVSWLSGAIAQLDQDSADTAAALADALARLLVVRIFTDAAGIGSGSTDE